MQIDSNIVKAIEKYLNENELMAMDLAASLGVSPATMTKWRKVGNGITDQKWDALFPLIKKYLPAERIYIDTAGVEQYSSAVQKESAYSFDPKYVPAMIPLFSTDDLAEYDNMLESAMQFGKRTQAKQIEYRAKHPNKQGVFALRLDNDDFAPVMPSGSTIFACTSETPVTGSVIVFKNAAGLVTIGRYQQKQSNFRITTLDSRSQLVQGKISEARSIITWAFPVLFYEVVTF